MKIRPQEFIEALKASEDYGDRIVSIPKGVIIYPQSKPCACAVCAQGDAWQCAKRRQLPGQLMCLCECHRKGAKRK